MESTGTNLMDDEQRREWCIVILDLKSRGFAMEFLEATYIIIVDEYKLLNLLLVNTRLEAKRNQTHIRKEANKESVFLERDRMVETES